MMSERIHANCLTARETDVLSLMCEGFSAKQVARKLKISQSTVVAHTANIFRKLNVNNRPHAVAVALKNNLLEALEV